MSTVSRCEARVQGLNKRGGLARHERLSYHIFGHQFLSGGQREGSQVLVGSCRKSGQWRCDVIAAVAHALFLRTDPTSVVFFAEACTFTQHTARYRCDGVRVLWCVCAGSIPEEVGGLVKLEELSLNENKLSGKGVCALVG